MSTNTKLMLLKRAARIRKLAAQLPSGSERTDIEVSLDDPAIVGSKKHLDDLEQIIVEVLQRDAEPSADSLFASRGEALAFARAELFPKISACFRLFKTAKLRQDEYIVVNRDWLYDMDTYQTYSTDRDVLDRLASAGVPLYLSYSAPSDKGVKALEVLKAWRQDPMVQEQRLNSLEYIPGGPDIVGHRFNTFKDVSVPAMSGVDMSFFLDHVRDNLCNGNVAYFEYLMKWLAHLVQTPAHRPLTGIAIIGDQGTGKGIFIDFIARMLGGRRNCNTTTSAKDTKSFNTAVGSKLLVVFDEATFSGDHEQSDFMKKLVTEPYVRIEPKGIDAYEVENYARCFITSNNMESAVPADIGARRWLIIECRSMQGKSDWLRDLANKIGNNGEQHPDAVPYFVNGFKHYLTTLDLRTFNPQDLPLQDTGMETKIHNHYKRDSVYAFLCEWLKAPELTLYRHKKLLVDGTPIDSDEAVPWSDEVRFGDLYAVYEEMCRDAHGKAIGRNRIGAHLERYGLTSFSKGQNVRFVRLPHPLRVLTKLRESSRFDALVSSEQEQYITDWRDTSEDFKGLIAVATGSSAAEKMSLHA